MKALMVDAPLWPDLYRGTLQVGISLALQSMLLLGLGLLAGRVLRRHGPALPVMVYRVTLVATLAGALLPLAAGRYLPPLWSSSLPSVAGRPAPAEAAAGWVPRRIGGGESTEGPLLRLPPLLNPANGDGATSRARAGNEKPEAATVAAEGTSRDPLRSRKRRSGPPIAALSLMLAGTWGTGTLLLLGRLLLCQLHLHRLRRNGRSIPVGTAAALLRDFSQSLGVRAPVLLASPQVQSPFLTGLWRPAILLPADHDRQFDGPTLRAILTHELVHLSRGDCAWNLLSRLACALGWMQPLVWVLSRRLEQASEELCDQEVVRREGDPRAYASCLLALSEQLRSSSTERALGVGAVPFRSSLGRRIQQILDSSQHRALPLSFRLRAAVALSALLAITMGTFLASSVAAPASGPDQPSTATGGQTGERRRAVLADIPELARPVTVTETKIPLGELVQRIAVDTGVKLVAAPEVADEPVAVVVKELPARELLEQLADLLDYMWSRRDQKGELHYEIWQDVASKQREEALRNARRADVIKRFQEELHRYTEMAAWTPERLQKFVDDAQRPTRADEPDPNERARRFFIATALTSPISREVVQLLGRLSPEQWAAVREGKPLTLSTDPQPGERGMPAETARVLRAAKPSLYPPGARLQYDDPDGPEQTRRIDQSLQEQWAAATGYRVTVQIDPYDWWNRNTLSLTAAARPFRTGAPPRSGFFDAYAGTSVKIRTEPLDHWSRRDEKAVPPEEKLAKDPVLGARQLFKPRAKPPLEPHDEHGPPVSRLRDLLPDLARTYQVQFIADAYTPAHVRLNAQPTPQPEALYRLLTRYASMSHQWDRRGRLIRLRSRTWFLDRPKEIPLRLVRHWKALSERHGALPLETYVAMATSLNDLQMENLAYIGEDVQLPKTLPLFEVSRMRYALRLYGALSPAQRQALWRGETLPVAQMTPRLRELFLASLAERRRHEPWPMNLENWTGGRLSLEAEPQVLAVERRAGFISIREERAAPTSGPGQKPLRPAASSGPASGTPRSQPATVTRHPGTRVKLLFWYAPEEPDTITLTVASSE